eukprot:TRINITY_DN1335_c0_g4_i1.p1 TRINITY_DN1335_c0_g4~~TRINITY_DN1335_c0_g4_i1.p1  ORF type:complete len:172 (-),score=25.68 TRINITY_DN1335_c0_g4_i1:393-908(-)
MSDLLDQFPSVPLDECGPPNETSQHVAHDPGKKAFHLRIETGEDGLPKWVAEEDTTEVSQSTPALPSIPTIAPVDAAELKTWEEMARLLTCLNQTMPTTRSQRRKIALTPALEKELDEEVQATKLSFPPDPEVNRLVRWHGTRDSRSRTGDGDSTGAPCRAFKYQQQHQRE